MSQLTCGHIQHMYSWWWVRLSPGTCRVKPLRRIKTQLLHLVGLISLLFGFLFINTCFKSTNNILNTVSVRNSKTLINSLLSFLSPLCSYTLQEIHIKKNNAIAQRFLTYGSLCHSLWVTMKLFNPYPTAFPYGNGMVLHFYQQQESSMTKTVHKVINKGLKAYV